MTGEHVAVVADIPHTVSGASVPLADLLASVAPRLDGGAKLVIDNVYGEYMAHPVAVTPQLLEERVAMQILRHAQFAITMEIYTVVSSEATREALKRLGKSLER